ncbi:site-specific integrase [Oscillibacter valericigenes]|uniref:tyrosine-type recombinase/integrase n=1 Tax=Oscillibacter valericigenes TaxID=351091 RepID=UPI001F3F7CB7|nr:site-specific integrase [Oscillibacter valericigenes]MCF2665097.1 site-specific integrase [Oscillibacter valericigenes]
MAGNKRAASGAGTIRKKTVKRKGKEYTYWEARYTEGYDSGTGKQIQRSITGKTQKEVAQKLRELTSAIDAGTYKEPCKMTVREWLDIWTSTYLNSVKPRTIEIYKSDIRLYINPALGSIRLEGLSTHIIQSFYNGLTENRKDGKKALSAKTVKNIHGVLHHALKQAVANELIRSNPADACTLPRIEKKELKPLDENEIALFLKAIHGHRFESIFLTTLFTGLREGEVLGLTWDCVDFDRGILLVNKQIQLHQEAGIDAYKLVSPKNGKSRSVAAAPSVIACLKRHKSIQAEIQIKAGSAWHNPDNLVFTDELGGHLTKSAVYRAFKSAVQSIGRPDARFHDMRHSYAVAAIRSGDDIKTIQSNLGHATAAFTLDVYGHVTDKMKQESASRMETFIKSVSGG